ncbi:reverse transcriptase [Purpureocillium lavendulum]|uniref:Reverse transcriptase n=1 Tax=Purpureocillium lavendulum TaxID=1247861 RepID=A0AB34FBW3_9HYPO|nr:reverse transcriptase [Purpureocillium lavendulum]
MKLGRLTLVAWLAILPAAIAKDKRSFAVLRFANKQLTIGRADPIVNPGGPSPHLHHVLGGSAFSVNATGKELQKSNCSTAKIKGDNSAYWFPSLFFRDPTTDKYENVEIYYAQVYYFFEPTNDETKAFPVGLSMVVGDAKTRSPPRSGATGNLDPSKGPANPVKWVCPRKNYIPPSWQANSDGTKAGMPNIHNKAEGVGFPDANCDEYASPLRADIHFPSCYNPSAGLTDFRNNMAYPSSAGDGKLDCPKGWVHVPHLLFEVYWNTPPFKNRWEPGQGKQPFVLSNGDATGYSLHGDFLSGWDESLLQHIIDTCDVGTVGMDKCSGLFYGVNNDDRCTIPSPVNEAINGVMDILPGNNPISGWSYGTV